jgi:hypothetical protein
MSGSGPPQRFDRNAYELEFEDRFDAGSLDPERWIAHFVPHWTTPERSAARYEIHDGMLNLRIEADQPAWRPEEGELRASGLQTGTWSGPEGSALGPHRHGPDPRVRTPQPRRVLYAPAAGAVEAELRASPDPTVMLAFWLVGLEGDSPEHSGEICVIELFGNAIGRESSELSLGVKAHHDPSLHDDMIRPRLPIDGTAWHTYSAEWSADEIRFYVDNEPVHAVRQSLTYPMLMLVGLFEFPESAIRDPASYPKTGSVRAVRGYRRLP